MEWEDSSDEEEDFKFEHFPANWYETVKNKKFFKN